MLLALSTLAAAPLPRCANFCSNRGFCDGDACICYPGFAGDDCSERSGARTKGGAPVAALQPAAVPVPEPNATVEATNATVDADAANASAIPASVQMLVQLDAPAPPLDGACSRPCRNQRCGDFADVSCPLLASTLGCDCGGCCARRRRRRRVAAAACRAGRGAACAAFADVGCLAQLLDCQCDGCCAPPPPPPPLPSPSASPPPPKPSPAPSPAVRVRTRPPPPRPSPPPPPAPLTRRRRRRRGGGGPRLVALARPSRIAAALPMVPPTRPSRATPAARRRAAVAACLRAAARRARARSVACADA